MKNEIAIEVNNLSKKYTKKDGSEFWALKDISFTLKKGETLGIIGANGSGKSTLLKILSGILKPSTGKAVLNGKIASILDIGTGFHPDLTGKENVFLSGSLMGMTRQEIENIYTDLVDFSELQDFIDEPVKAYSSGMYMRLAFSIFAFLRPEVLILDEVFSVGDVAFQKKCNDKLRILITEGISVIIVAHDMNEISTICNRVILLNEGKKLMKDSTMKVVNYYLEFVLKDTISKINYKKIFEPGQFNNGYIELISSTVNAKDGGNKIYRDQDIEINLKYKQSKKASIQIVVSIVNSKGEISLMDSHAIRKEYEPHENDKGYFIQKIIIPQNLLNAGIYFVNFTIGHNYDHTQTGFKAYNVNSFKVNLREWNKKNSWVKKINSHFRPNLYWNLKKIVN